MSKNYNNKTIAKWKELSETFSIIPLNGKIPVEKGWNKWCEEKRPFDSKDFIGKNAGIACGPASRVIVLDVDHLDLFSKLIKRHGWTLPKTKTVKTGKGMHYYFRYPMDGREYGNKSHKEVDPDNTRAKVTVFDIRGLGGQVVAEGSVHPDTGKIYKSALEGPIADPPDWLIELYCEERAPNIGRPKPPKETVPSNGDAAQISVESLNVPDDKKSLISKGESKGSRSEAMMSVVTSMLLAGHSDAQIKAVMDKYPIGEKYREKGASREKWIAGMISKAKSFASQLQNQQATGPRSKATSDMLYEIGSECHLFQNSGEGYARIQDGNHTRVLRLASKEFKKYLRSTYRTKYGKNSNRSAVEEAVDNLQATAQEKCPEETIFCRIGKMDDHIYVDLGTEDMRAVDIHPSHVNGWSVIQNPPVNFIRKKTMLPLPTPVPGGSLDDLRPIINCPNEKTWKMIVSWLVGALSPESPYPVLIVHGEQGAAKSNLSKICHRLIDPSDAELRGLPQDVRSLMITANNSWALSFDNLSGMRRQFSDAFCRLSTGGAFTPRKLYEDDEEIVFRLARPVILTGINNIVKMPDLLDRSILVELPALSPSRRKTESQITSHFNQVYPRVLGALYTAIAGAIQNRQSVVLSEKPRMADFAVWVTAAESALGWNQGDFMKSYTDNRSTGAESTLENFPLARAIIDFMEDKTEWEGYATPLLNELNNLPGISEEIKRSKDWPKAANRMSNILTTIAPVLRSNKGIDIQRGDTNKGSLITIKKHPQLSLVQSRNENVDCSDAGDDISDFEVEFMLNQL